VEESLGAKNQLDSSTRFDTISACGGQTDRHATTAYAALAQRRAAKRLARSTTTELNMTVYKCLHGLAPKYLAELYVPVADVAGRRQLRSASRGLLNFRRYNLSNYGRRAFCFAGPYVEHIRLSTSIAVFKRSLKTFLLKVTLKVHELKMTDKENYGSGKCKSGK